MITSKNINIFIIGILVFALIFTGILVFFPSTSDNESIFPQQKYVSNLFDKNKVSTIDIKVDETEWKKMLDSAKEEYISCDVTINGTTVKSVGIRPKGNSSLSMVASSDSDRFSFKFEFDHYIDGQNYLGLDKMVINNVQSDNSYMKDYLSYDLMTFMGVKTPLFAYTDVTVNGKSWGFYIAVEALEESFAERNYGSDYGMLYKPESMEMGGGIKDFVPNRKVEGNVTNKAGANNAGANTAGTNKAGANGQKNNQQNGQQNSQKNGQQNNQQNNQQSNPQDANANGFGGRGGMKGFDGGGFPGGGGFGGGSGGGTDLKYIDDKISSYSNIFDNNVFKATDNDYIRVIKAIKNLNSGTELEKYIDVDATLRYLAASTVLVNLDSYFSSMKHNYYLYEDDGKLTMLPWDYNLAFGGFQSGSAQAAVNFPIDTPVSGVDMSERPMLAKLLEVDQYKDKYHQYLQEIVDNYFNNGRYESTINNVNTLISDYVKKDPSAFCTFEQYSAAVSMMKEFGRLRALSIDGQLKGTIPSTSDGQSKASDKLIDSSSVNLSTMGSQGFGGGGLGGNRQNRNVNGESTNNAQQNPQQQNNQTTKDNQKSTGPQEGAMQPPAGQQPPEGFQPSDGMQPPEGFQPPDGMQLPEGFQPPDRMQQGGNSQAGNNQGMLNLLIIGGSTLFLLAGLIFVIRYRRKKYVKV